MYASRSSQITSIHKKLLFLLTGLIIVLHQQYPHLYAKSSLVPPSGLLKLPFASSVGNAWQFSQGPHNYNDGANTPLSSIDFAKKADSGGNCDIPTTEFVTAAASGTIFKPISGDPFEIRIDHDGALFGYSTTYLHVAKQLVHIGDYVKQGALLGNPSCLGGNNSSTGPHVHFTLLFAGIYADIRNTTLDNWVVKGIGPSSSDPAYLERGSEKKSEGSWLNSDNGNFGRIGELRGKVKYIDSTPASGITVKFVGGGERRTIITDGDGLYRFAAVPEGDAIVSALNFDATFATTIRDGEITTLPDMILRACVPHTAITQGPVRSTGSAIAQQCGSSREDNATFLSDVTLTDKTDVTPGQDVVKTWRMRNSGKTIWGSGYQLVFRSGSSLGAPPTVNVPAAMPGQEVNLSVGWRIAADTPSGIYRGYWQMRNAQGTYFGQQIWFELNVSPGGNNKPPERPSLVSPGDWSVYTGQTPTLCARSNSDPDGDAVTSFFFDIYESAQLWSSGWVTSETTNACVTPQGLNPYGYQWRVKVRDSRGLESAWSETRRFNIYSTSVSVTDFHFEPGSPSNASTVRVWASTTGCGGMGVSLRLHANTANDGTTNGEWRQIAGELGVASYTPGNTPYWDTLPYTEGRHVLRLQVKSCDGTVTTADQTYELLRGRPSRPPLSAPEQDSWSNDRTVTFRWQPSLRANSYMLVVGTTLDPRQSPIVNVPVNGTEYTTTFNQDYGRLYWKVYALNEIGESDSDGERWFGIDQVAPTSTVNGQRTHPVSFENQFAVSWDSGDDSSGVSNHDIQVRVLPNGEWTNWLTSYPYASAIFTGQPGRTYQFRSRARDKAGNIEAYLSTYDVAVQIDPTQRPPEPWWNAAYATKRTVIVANRMGNAILPTKYPVQLRFDNTTTPTAAELFAASATQNGNDLRIIYNNQVEIPRQILTFSQASIDLWFPVQADIPSGDSSSAYTLYVGNGQATDPDFSPRDVFVPNGEADTRLLLSFNEGSGTTAVDTSGNGNNGVLEGAFGQPWPEGWFATGLRFDGVSSRVQVDDNASLQLTNQIAVEAWVRPTVIDNRTRNIIAKFSPLNGSDTAAYRLFLRDGYPIFDIYSTNDQSRVEGLTRLQQDRWYHLAGVYDGSALRLFINGEEIRTTAYNKPFRAAPGAWIAIGNSGYLNEVFAGDIDQVRISANGRTSFPYGRVSANPVAAAGEQQSPEPAVGQADLRLNSLTVTPNPDGGLLVEASLANNAAFPTYNEVLIHLYADRTPNDSTDAMEEIGGWVNAPVAAGSTLDLTTVIPSDAFSGATQRVAATSRMAPAADQSFTLVAQVEVLGALVDVDISNNILSDSQVCLASGDAYERDDMPTQGRAIAWGETQQHDFDHPGDQDWFKLTTIAGATYTLRTASLDPSTDTTLEIYDTDGATLLATNDDYESSLASQITWTAPTRSTYYVLVRHWNPQAGGCGASYSVSLTGQINLRLPIVLAAP